ncbi:MAG: glycosyltransferase family 2 protein, partial [Rhodothermales bacterium]
MIEFVRYTEWVFLTYFASLHFGYFVLAMLAFAKIVRYVVRRNRDLVRPVFEGYEPAVSVVVPTYNMEPTVLATISGLIEQRFESLQIIIVNDGSSDKTLDVVIAAYDMVPTPMPPKSHLPSQPVRRVYRSRSSEDILLLDKENGKKADANNAGVNYARHSLVCVMDADSVLEPDTLHRTVRMFIERPETIAAGGTLLVLNGCHVGRKGFVDHVRIAESYWARVQTMEYIRAFLFGRLGFAF